MDIDFSLFDGVYDILVHDIIKRLSKKFSGYNVEIENKKYIMEDIVILHIGDSTFNFDVSKYIDQSSELGEDEAFKKLVEKINTLLD